MLQDKRQDRMQGIEIVNALQRSDGSRAKWQTEKTKKENENNMYETVISNYEDIQKELLKENHEMRQTLKTYQQDLLNALNRQTCVDETNLSGFSYDKLHRKTSSAPTDEKNSYLMDDVFKLPYDIIKDDVEAQFSSKWSAIKRKISDQTNKLDNGSGDNNSNLSQLNQIITEQQKIIDYLTSKDCIQNGEKYAPDDVYFLEEKSELEKHKLVFKQQQELLQKEKTVYTEALIKLGEDRQAFELEKSTYLQSQFLQLTPFRTESKEQNDEIDERKCNTNEDITNNEERGVTEGDSFSKSINKCEQQMRNGYFSPNITRKTPVHRSAALSSMPSLPSTIELYRAIGLSSCKSKQPIQEHLFACKKQLRMGEY